MFSTDQQRPSDLTITTGETISGSDTGLSLQQLTVNTGNHEIRYVGYVTPTGNHLIITQNDSNTFPDHLTLDEYYIKQGADFTPSGATVTVLGHSGMNLADGVVHLLEDTHDVATIGWSPTYTYEPGVEWGDGVWLRSNYESAEYSYVADMGSAALKEITSVPSSWPAS